MSLWDRRIQRTSRCTHSSRRLHLELEFAEDRSKEDEKRVDNFRSTQTPLRLYTQSRSRRSLTVASSDILLEVKKEQKGEENMEM
jgi:hypothetical protein